MGEIVASVQRVTDIMAEISAASQEQFRICFSAFATFPIT